MVKNFFLVIFISVLVISCDNQNNIFGTNDNTDFYYLNLTSYLEKDESGYYRMNLLNSYNQTFTTLKAETGSDFTVQKVSWTANKEINIDGYWVQLVNSSSYTDNFGEAHTVFSGWYEFLQDTITVFAEYDDEFGNNYLDSLKIIVE